MKEVIPMIIGCSLAVYILIITMAAFLPPVSSLLTLNR